MQYPLRMAVTDDVKDPVRFVEARGAAVSESLNSPQDMPAALYHYTSGQGLLGILSSGDLNCTNLLYMNDSSEMDYGRAIVRKMAANCSPASGPVQLFLERLISDIEQPDFHYYVTCFCEKPDLLSQWRAYGGQAAGYSLGFDADDLETVLPENSELVQVMYDPEEQQRSIESALQSSIAVAEECCAACHGNPRLEESMSRWAAFSSNQISRLIARMKSEAFAEEHEWRAVIMRFSFDTSGFHFRLAANGIVVPYYPWHFKQQGIKALRQIQHGPTVNSVLAVRSIGLLLQNLGYRDVGLKASVIPLRF